MFNAISKKFEKMNFAPSTKNGKKANNLQKILDCGEYKDVLHREQYNITTKGFNYRFLLEHLHVMKIRF